MLEQRFSTDWLTPHLPTWRRLLAPLAGVDGARILEIGSFEGRSACFFLEEILTGQGAELYCIDPWSGDCEAAYARFLGNTIDAYVEGRIVELRGTSAQYLPQLAASSVRFDAIYVDGDHRAVAVLADAIGAWEVLKPGGLLIFDDYGLERVGTAAGPAGGVDAFVRVAGERIEVLERGWQVIVRRREWAAALPPLVCGMHGEPHLDGTICGRL